MKRWAILAYGVFAYVMFFGVFLYAIAFIGNFLVPLTLDSQPISSVGTAAFINLLLLSAFALQHSLMARPILQNMDQTIHP